MLGGKNISFSKGQDVPYKEDHLYQSRNITYK